MKMKTDIDLLYYEKKLYHEGYNFIVGVDEAGRGPLMGPVVAGAVILPKHYQLEGLTDSKQLSEKKRDAFFAQLQSDAIAIGIGIVEAKIIDEINIYQASKLAMKLVIDDLKIKPDYILSDAMLLAVNIPCLPIKHGDALSLSIAAGSVIAKVTRDKILYEIDKQYPKYEFKKHKGYPTKRHLELLNKYGPLDNYRFTYKPVRDLIIKGEMKDEEVYQ